MESEGCWEVITCRPYEHHVSLGCSQTCLSFPLWTDLTPAVTWRGIHSVWSLRSFFFLISTRLSHGLWIWMSFSLLLSYRMPGPTESLTSWPCMEIMRSSGVLQQIPPRTSRSHVLFSYLSPPLPLSLPGWELVERWSDINLLLSLTSTVAWWIMKPARVQSNCFV